MEFAFLMICLILVCLILAVDGILYRKYPRLRPWARTERAARFYERHPHAVLFVFGAAYAGFLLMMLQIVVRAVFG